MQSGNRDYLPYLVALDPASVTGVARGALGSTPALETIRFRFPRDTAVQSYGLAARWMDNLLQSTEVDVLAIEVPIAAWGQTTYSTISWANGLFGLLAGMAQAHDVIVLPVEVRTWRKFFLGKGDLPAARAKEQAVIRCQMLGWETNGKIDAAEAGGIWLWGCGELQSLRIKAANSQDKSVIELT